jgi:hypothetical protein
MPLYTLEVTTTRRYQKVVQAPDREAAQRLADQWEIHDEQLVDEQWDAGARQVLEETP